MDRIEPFVNMNLVQLTAMVFRDAGQVFPAGALYLLTPIFFFSNIGATAGLLE